MTNNPFMTGPQDAPFPPGLGDISPDSFEVDLSDVKDNFKIPDGYSSIEKETDVSDSNDVEDIDGTAVDSEKTSEYSNAAGDELEIQVGSKNNQKIDSINPGGDKKNIAGKDGFLIKDMDDGKNKYKFEYLQDGKIVKITAVSEDIIGQVIV